MIWKNSRYIWLGAAVAIVQSGALYAMVAQRASILRSGTNITLLTEPVDPNVFLRGDYVSLGYGISTVEAGKVGGTPPAAAGPTDIYVTVKPGDDRVWTLSEASWQRREDVPDGQIQLRGRTTHSMNSPASSQLRITYGIERYYVPEGHGLVIENQQRERKIEAVIAVSPDGEAQIRALKNDGEIMYEEPIY